MRSLKEYNMVLKAESSAIETCKRNFVRGNVRGRYKQICTNSQVLKNTETTLPSAREVKDALKAVARTNGVIVIRIPNYSEKERWKHLS